MDNMKDKKLRNKIEIAAIVCYTAGLLLTCYSKCPLFMGTTLLTIPISKNFKEFKENKVW